MGKNIDKEPIELVYKEKHTSDHIFREEENGLLKNKNAGIDPASL